MQHVTRLFLTWVEFFSFHFKQVRIQTVPASHLQQGTVSGSTKAVSTVVVTTAPSPKQTQDQLWTLVWKQIAFQELPWICCHLPSYRPRQPTTVMARDWTGFCHVLKATHIACLESALCCLGRNSTAKDAVSIKEDVSVESCRAKFCGIQHLRNVLLFFVLSIWKSFYKWRSVISVHFGL